MKQTGPWGYHLIIELSECNKDDIKNAEWIKDFCKTLVKEIDMEPYGEPQVIHFGNDYLEGNTLMQLITTSNITAHFNDIDGSAYFDLFSCKKFDKNIAIELINEYFLPKKIRSRMLIRQAPGKYPIPGFLRDLYYRFF